MPPRTETSAISIGFQQPKEKTAQKLSAPNHWQPLKIYLARET